MTASVTNNTTPLPEETPDLWWYCVQDFLNKTPGATEEATAVVLRFSRDVYKQIVPIALNGPFERMFLHSEDAPPAPAIRNKSVIITQDKRPNVVSWTWLNENNQTISNHWTDLRGTADAMWDQVIGSMVEATMLEQMYSGRSLILHGDETGELSKTLYAGVVRHFIDQANQAVFEMGAGAVPDCIQLIIPAQYWKDCADTMKDGEIVPTSPANIEDLQEELNRPTIIGSVGDWPGTTDSIPVYITGVEFKDGEGQFGVIGRFPDSNLNKVFLAPEAEVAADFMDWFQESKDNTED